MRRWASCLAVFCLWIRTSQAVPEFVTVGHPNNLPDTNGWPTEFGTVPYDYKISKFETKVSEYVAFLNSVATTSDPYGLFGGAITHFIDRSGAPPFLYTAKSGASNKPIGESHGWQLRGTPIGCTMGVQTVVIRSSVLTI